MSVKPELAFDVCWEVYRGALSSPDLRNPPRRHCTHSSLLSVRAFQAGRCFPQFSTAPASLFIYL